MHLCKSFRWGEERLHRSPKSFRWGEERLHRSPKSFRWGEERLHRSPKSLRWDEEPLYRSPRVRKFYTFLPAKHCSGGRAESQKSDSFKGLWRPVFGHAVRCIPLGANNQWGIRKTPTD